MRTLFAGDRRGVAAVEFAFVFPVALMLMLGVFEFANVITAGRRLEVVAGSIGQMLTQTSTGSVIWADVQFAMDSTMVLFPTVLSDSHAKGVAWGQDISVTASSIVFSKQNPSCTSNCVYNANVAWSAGSAKRPCDVNGQPQITPVADASAPSPTTLPTDAYGPVSLVVVDVLYNYRPILWNKAFPPFALKRSTYIRPRYIPPTSYIAYSVIPGDTGIATKCTGY